MNPAPPPARRISTEHEVKHILYIMLAIKLGYPGMILYRRAIYGKRSPDAQRPTRLFRRPTRLSVVKEYESCEGWKIEGG